MLVQKPIAFESLDFLPGFPTLSKFACNPWSQNIKAGACVQPPQVVGRERSGAVGWDAVTTAIRAAGGQVPSLSGLGGSGSRGSDRHILRLYGLSAGHGAEHHRPDYGYEAGTLRNDMPGYHARLGGCSCGGTCGGCGGMGDFSAAGIWSWVQTNWLPLVVGAAVIWMFKRR